MQLHYKFRLVFTWSNFLDEKPLVKKNFNETLIELQMRQMLACAVFAQTEMQLSTQIYVQYVQYV